MSDSFTTSPKSRLHVLTIQYLGYHHGSHTRYCVFVHNRTFLAYVAYYQAGHSPANLYVPWRRWGPMCTRFFAGHVPFTWLRYVVAESPAAEEIEAFSAGMYRDRELYVPKLLIRRPEPCKSSTSTFTHLAVARPHQVWGQCELYTLNLRGFPQTTYSRMR